MASILKTARGGSQKHINRFLSISYWKGVAKENKKSWFQFVWRLAKGTENMHTKICQLYLLTRYLREQLDHKAFRLRLLYAPLISIATFKDKASRTAAHCGWQCYWYKQSELTTCWFFYVFVPLTWWFCNWKLLPLRYWFLSPGVFS